MMRLAKPAILTALALAALPLRAAEWPNWRGPNFDGSSPEKGLPVQFSRTNNVKWSADLPGPSASTPVVWGDRIFVSTTDKTAKSVKALCLDRRSGKVLWQHEVAPGFSRDDRSNFASPSPVTDGKSVWFFYGNGELVCFSVAGKEVWRRNIQKDHGTFAYLWTFSTSPVLHNGVLYLQVLQRDTPVDRSKPLAAVDVDKPIESFLLAMNPATGKDLWKSARPSDAKAESRESFTTPMPFKHAGREELIIVGGDCITGHDPKDGKELWRWATWNPAKIGHWRLVPSSVAGAGIILACAPKGAPVYAFKAGQSGTLPDTGIAWTSQEQRDVSSDVSTPAFANGRFYVVNSDKKILSCVEPATGNVLWSGKLETEKRSKLEGSPTVADGKVYVMNHAGEVFVCEAGNEFKQLHVTAMGDAGERDLRSGIAVAAGNLFIRTAGKLWCVGK